DLNLLTQAYNFAKSAHKDQLRKSGDLYIVHPLATAITLAKLDLDQDTIIAGLLHDVPEDTDRTLKEVKKEFGKHIAFLVEGVTKLGLLKYRGADRYIENLRHMFVAMAKDVRIILIKFADRINNLQTLSALPKDKQKRIALESLEIYAPIANRLGMGKIRGQLEDLSFPYVYPTEYKWLMAKINPRLKEKEKFINLFINFIKKEFEKHDIKLLAIHGRAKHLYSLYRKLLKYDRDLSKIYDLMAVRLIVEDVARCYEALGIIHELCKPLKGRIKDYISQPKPNGYQSLHTTVFSPSQFSQDKVHGEIVEIQIRTPRMHKEAAFGIAAHWQYKEGVAFNKESRDQRLMWMKNLIELQNEIKDENQLLETLKINVFQNYIFIFTPLGDVIELPEDATPVDFAYQIHTELGNKCCGVKINNHISHLHTTLKSGDVVEIFTDEHRKGPDENWLKFVKTNAAQYHIRKYINKKRKKLLNFIPFSS
ncbi:MAG: hypothetical protein A2458_01590, partial [Candidatus Kerfeldbacteria bacterium RIFOXYC2_FULL_38_9]